MSSYIYGAIFVMSAICLHIYHIINDFTSHPRRGYTIKNLSQYGLRGIFEVKYLQNLIFSKGKAIF